MPFLQRWEHARPLATFLAVYVISKGYFHLTCLLVCNPPYPKIHLIKASLQAVKILMKSRDRDLRNHINV